MSTFRFVHTADLHLDCPFRGLGRRARPDVARALVAATFDAFDRVIALCREEKVDALLVAGDVYDGADRGLRSIHRFRRGLIELAEHGIDAFVVHGNHDPLSSDWNVPWPERVHVFGAEPGCFPLRARGETVAHVVGMSFPVRDVAENLARRFVRPGESPYAIGLLHANVGRDTGHAPYAPCTLEDLVLSGLDYWALGHVHAPQVLRERHPTVVYAGTPQGLTRSDLGPRGCCLVTVAGGQTSVELVETDVVRWDHVEITLTGTELGVRSGLGSVADTLRHAIAARVEEAQRSLVVRATLDDPAGALGPSWGSAAFEPLLEDLEKDFSTPDRFVLVESLTVRAAPRPLPAMEEGEVSLAGELAQLAGEIRAGADLGTYREALRPLVLELVGARCGEPPDDTELTRLLEEAAGLAAGLLVEEGS